MSEQDFRFISANRNDRKDFQPLVLNPNSHPGYTPVKLNVKTANDLKLIKSKPPEKPMVPYMRYSRKVWDSVKATNPEAKLWEIGKIIGQMWRDLADYEKQEYINDYENAKAEYCEQIKNYHNSPLYQNFLSNAAKKKGKDDIKMSNGMSTNALISSNIINTLNNNRLANNDLAVSHYAIEPAEDDGIDDSLSVRHVASNRFNRNNRLLNEIFNEYTVADNRSIVTSQRMEQLKKQVTSLELHQDKLKQELQTIEEKYELKKKKILDSSSDFQTELEKLNEFTVTETQLKSFYEKHYEGLEKQWKENVERILVQSGTSILDTEPGLEALRNNLESLVSNPKAITTPTLSSSITLVALHQIMEPTPAASGTTVTPAQTAANNMTPAVANSAIHHTNTMTTAATVVPAVINQPHNPYQQHPQQHTMFNQQQMQHQHQQQVMHGMQMQNTAQTNAHHMHLQHQNQTPAHHSAQPNSVPMQHSAPATQAQINMAQPHAMPGMHHQMPPQQPQQSHMQPNMMNTQNMIPNQTSTSTTDQYAYPNQMSHQGYQGYGQATQGVQQPGMEQQNNTMYPNQMNYPSPQQQQQYNLQQQQQYQMQRAGSTGPFIPNAAGQRMVNPTQIQSPNPNQMMMMNRAPVPNQMQPGQVPAVGAPNAQNQGYQNFMIGQNQFNQQGQQFRTSNTPPINNPSNIVSPSQHMQQQPASSTTPNPGLPIQQVANIGAPNVAQAQSPMANRIPPAQSQQPAMMQTNPAQAQPQMQVRHGVQAPGTPQQMNFYNPQQQQQSHMYGMVHQQQQQFRDPNMLSQVPNQMSAYGAQGNVAAQPPVMHANGQASASPQQAQPTAQQYNMIQNNPAAQPVMMQQPNGQPNMIYAQHPQNMMYQMPQQQQQPNNMNPQQVIMMQQQTGQMMNNQYQMYQNQGIPVQQQQQQQQPAINPASTQQPQQNNSATNQQAQPQQPSTPQPAEPKTKGKKKQKTAKANATETS